jgi:hypothetical protein
MEENRRIHCTICALAASRISRKRAGLAIACMIATISGVAHSKSADLKLFQDERTGIEFRYPGFLLTRQCPEDDDSDDQTHYIACLFHPEKLSERGGCDLEVKVSTKSVEQVAQSVGWQFVSTDSPNLPNTHRGDWVPPSRAAPFAAQPVQYNEWIGLTGYYSGESIDDDGSICSVCATGSTTIVSNGSSTAIIDFVNTDSVDSSCNSPDILMDIILQTLKSVGDRSTVGLGRELPKEKWRTLGNP